MPRSTSTDREQDKLLGKMLREERQARGLSQSELARELGISYQQVQKYEAGASIFSVSRLKQVCDVLDMDIAECFAILEGQPVRRVRRLISHEEIRFLRLFVEIRDLKMRRKAERFLVHLARWGARTGE